MHPERVPSQDEVLQIFRRAGLRSLTPLQERIIPAILRGKDVAADTEHGSGATTGSIFPLVVGLRAAGTAPRAVILVPSVEDVGKAARAHARFSRAVRDAPSFVPLGEIDDVRREQRRLEKGATIVAGTVERVIDHLRRGSLDISRLETAVVMLPEGEAREDFAKDIQFIFAKLASRPQTILLGRSLPPADSELMSLLHRPAVIGAEEPGQGEAETSREGSHAVFDTSGRDKAEVLARVLVGRRFSSAIVFHPPRADAERIARELRRFSLRVEVLPPAGRRRPASLSLRGMDALIVPLTGASLTGAEIEGLAPSAVVYFDLPSGGGKGVPRVHGSAAVITLADSGQEKEINRRQEAIGAAMRKEQIPSDEEMISGFIDRIIGRIKEEGRDDLAVMRSRIRRQVPFLLRSWFTASLLRAQFSGAAGVPPAPGRRAQGDRAGQERRGEASLPPVPKGQAGQGQAPRGRFGRSVEAPRQPKGERPAREGEFMQLFVSIGRNMKVFHQDLTDLFTGTLHLSAGEIGGVRVFDKYSFVDIAPGRAGEAIAKLSGVTLKGRTITVNYAKKKEEKKGR